MPLDLSHPDCEPPDCPEWAKETLPPHIQRFRGRNGMPSPYAERTEPLALNVRGVDRYHANQFIPYRIETADYLYNEYTPLEVNYRKGLLPSCEELARDITDGLETQTEKLLALVTEGMKHVKHPVSPCCGPPVEADRNLDDESLLKSGKGWCNEQARVLIRLCQALGIQGRICQTFYSDTKTGHCIAECYVDGGWAMVDATWLCAFPGPDGRLLSAADCHDGGEGQRHCGLATFKRKQELGALSDEELNFPTQERLDNFRKQVAEMTAEDWANRMNCFALINYPLPT